MNSEFVTKISNGRVSINGAELPINGFEFVNELGRGANGVVFRATDTLLGREVAIKLWNQRGAYRSKDEISKIAKFQHPLIVSTYQFGYVQDVPFAIMELAKGITGKAWLERNPGLHARMRFWGRYSEAIKTLHDSNVVHGDPHMGNVILLDPSLEPNQTNIGLDFIFKLADTGTSILWANHDHFIAREEKLIVETANRLFGPYGLGKLFQIPSDISYVQAINLIDRFVEYLWRVYDFVDFDRRSQNATFIAEHIIATPLFDIGAVIEQVKTVGVTDRARLCRRLNASLLNYFELDLEQDQLCPEALEVFKIRKIAYTNSLKQRTHPGFVSERPGESSFRFAHWY